MSANPHSLARRIRVTAVSDIALSADVLEGENTRQPLTVLRAGWGLYRKDKDLMDGACQIGSTEDQRAVWKKGDRLFMVVHDAKLRRTVVDVDPSVIVREFDPPIPWDPYRDQKDDVLAAIREGVLEPEAEYCPILIFQPCGDKVKVLVDGQHVRTVEASVVEGISMRALMMRLGIPSAAVEIRPTSVRVGVLLPPHICLLPRKAAWTFKGSKNRAYFVLNYRPMNRSVKVVEFNWKDDDTLASTTKVIEIRKFLKAARRGELQAIDLESEGVPPALQLEMKRYRNRQ